MPRQSLEHTRPIVALPMSLINSIPTEILIKIFTITCTSDLSPNDHAFLDNIPRLRTTLRLVHKEWDRLIVSTPSLWNQITLALPDDSSHIAIPPEWVLGHWLDRSDPLPIYVAILFPWCLSTKATALLTALWTSVLRWKKAEFRFQYVVPHILAGYNLARAHSLETLRIIDAHGDEADIEELFGLLGAAPLLRNVHLNIRRPYVATALKNWISLAKLEELTFEVSANYQIPDMWDVLRACVSLVRLSIRQYAQCHLTPTSTPIHMHQLRVLDFESVHINSSCPLLMLSCPLLEELSFSVMFYDHISPSDVVRHLVSSCNPDSLLRIIRLHFWDEVDVICCLDQTHLENIPVVEMIFRTLSPTFKTEILRIFVAYSQTSGRSVRIRELMDLDEGRMKGWLPDRGEYLNVEILPGNAGAENLLTYACAVDFPQMMLIPVLCPEEVLVPVD